MSLLSAYGQVPILLAPMAGVSDGAFRSLCYEQGCDIAYTEMISAKGLCYENENTAALLPLAGERPIAVQLFGREPAVMAEAARRVARLCEGRLAWLDINMGCPARKIVRSGEGSALLDEPLRAAAVVEAVVAAAAPVPVSVKLRAGRDEEHIVAVPFAQMLENSGAALLALHPRTREQMYSGKADWSRIAQVKSAVRIPVLGNGDIFTGADAAAMRAQTGCDGVMAGRGALGNPFLFAQMRRALAGLAYADPTPGERLAMAREHARRLVALRGPRAIVEMRKHVGWYTHGLRGAAALRVKINAAATPEEMFCLLSEYEKSISPRGDFAV